MSLQFFRFSGQLSENFKIDWISQAIKLPLYLIPLFKLRGDKDDTDGNNYIDRIGIILSKNDTRPNLSNHPSCYVTFSLDSKTRISYV